MELIKLIVLVSALITKICLAGLNIETSEPDKSRLVEETINLLESCYRHRIDTVGLAGGVLAGSISQTLSTREFLTPGTLIEDTSRIVKNGPVSRTSRYKLQIFVVAVTNSSTLAKTLMQIKKSVWWNHMASFILLDLPVSKNGCSNAYEMLWEAWKTDLLNTKFMCVHRSKGPLIYTYNPYTIKAPVPWQLERTYKRKNDHISGLFVQAYRDDKEICDVLDFDKTTDIGGYEIRASVQGLETWWYTDSNRKPTTFNRGQNISAQILISAINGTWKFQLYPEIDTNPVDQEGRVFGDMAEVINGVTDIGLTFRMQHSTINYTTLYPQFETTLAIVTQYRGYMSQLDKIVSLLDSCSRFGLVLVCLITLLFFKCYLHKPLMPAILDLVLIVCNAPLLTIPKKLGPRIYLGCLFLFVLTIQGIYQGKLASLLTKRKPLPNVNTVEDLVRFGYTIYGHEMFYPYFEKPDLKERFVGLKKFNCTGFVLRDSKAACVMNKLTLMGEAAEFKLHLSYDISMIIYGVYMIRSDWPLEERANTIAQRTTEGNLIKLMIVTETHRLMHVVNSHEYEGQDQKFEAINLGELSFAFVILGIGLGFATIIFMIEIGVHRSRIAGRLVRPIGRLIKSMK